MTSNIKAELDYMCDTLTQFNIQTYVTHLRSFAINLPTSTISEKRGQFFLR